MNKMLVMLAPLVLLTGCVEKYEDVPSDQAFGDLLGRRFEVRQELLIHGVTDSTSHGAPIDYYDITPRPGYSGPEVRSRESVPVGTVLQVTGLERCTNCWPATVRAGLLLSGPSRDTPVFIDLEFIRQQGLMKPTQ